MGRGRIDRQVADRPAAQLRTSRLPASPTVPADEPPAGRPQPDLAAYEGVEEDHVTPRLLARAAAKRPEPMPAVVRRGVEAPRGGDQRVRAVERINREKHHLGVARGPKPLGPVPAAIVTAGDSPQGRGIE